MKKLLSTVAIATCFASVASADFARVELGAGAWMQNPSGKITYDVIGADGSDTSKENSESLGYAWLLIKHPIPIIPNLRVEYANIKSEGTATGQFKEFNIGTTPTNTLIEMKQYDLIPYYNILDNTFWMTLDLGLDIKIMDTKYTADPVALFNGYSTTNTITLPLLYARTRVEIPLTGFGVEADVKYVSYDSNTVYDVRVKVDYTLEFIPIVQPAIEVGYRVQHIETNGDTEAAINMDFKGVYAGVMLRF